MLLHLFSRIRFSYTAGLLLLSATLLASCSSGSRNVYFKNKEHREYYRAQRKQTDAPIIYLKPDSLQEAYEYRFEVGDFVELKFLNFPEATLKLILEASGALNPQGGGFQSFSYLIDNDGYVAVPLIGRVYAIGKTMIELRGELEEKFKVFVRDPVLQVTAPSQRVILLGYDSPQTVVALPRERTSLAEVIALSGIPSFSTKIKKIKIIRGQLDNPQVIWIDLRRFDALQQEAFIVHHMDIIVMEPRGVQLFLREASLYTGIIGLANAVLTIILFTRL